MTKSHRYRKTEFAALLVALYTSSTDSAIAETLWEKTSPCRDQDNDRLARQNKCIAPERKEGEIAKGQGNCAA